MTSSPYLPFAWMLASAFAFSGMAICTKGLAGSCPWQVIAVFRAGLAMTFAGILTWQAGAQFAFLKPKTLWMRSLAGSVSLLCGFYAMTHTDISEVLVVTNMYPLWVAVLSWPLLREFPSTEVWVAIALSITGLCLMEPPKAIEGKLAFGAALLSSFTSGIALIGLHKLKKLDPRAIVTHFSGVATLLSIGACFVFPLQGETAISARLVLLLLGVGLSATAGQLFLTKAFTTGNAARVSIVGLSQVAIVMALEILLWGKTFSPKTLAGMALVVAPTAWMMLRRAR